MTFKLVEPDTQYPKRIKVTGPVDLYVDVDDGIPGGDAGRLIAKAVVYALNNARPYKAPWAWFCENEDCGSRGEAVEMENHDHDGICFECKSVMEWKELDF